MKIKEAKTLTYYVDSINKKVLVYRFSNSNNDVSFFAFRPKKDNPYEIELLKLGPSEKSISTIDFSFDEYCNTMPFRVHSRDLMLLKNIINDSVIIRAINLVMESLYSAIKLLTDSSNNVEVNELLFKDPDSKLFLLDLVSLKQITGIEGIDPNTVCMAVDDFHSLCRMVFYCHISDKLAPLFVQLFNQDVSKVELS
jgi:hypothetical protein